MNRVKVIFCTDGIFPKAVGGMQRHSRLLIEELAKTGEVDLVVVHPHEESLFKEFPNVKEVKLQGIDTQENYLKESYNYSKRVYEAVQQHPQHVIYSQGLSVWYNADKVKERLIINPHGLEPFQAIGFKDKLIAIPFKLIFSKLFRTASRVVSLGGRLTGILKNTLGNKAGRIAVLPNAVNIPSGIDASSKKINDPLQFLFVARFATNKGIHILLEAIKRLNEEGYKDKIVYNLGGKGPLFEHYRTNYNYSNVNYLGFISDEQLNELYRTNDLFIFPTLFEGMPTVVLEAMSHAMPVIVSDTGATAELVNNSNGFLIEKNNTDALIDAVKKFYDLPIEEKKKLSAESYRKVNEQFTWKRVAGQHVELFREVASRASATNRNQGA